jgi:RNA polymerase sigma factor (sigma-70 family)
MATAEDLAQELYLKVCAVKDVPPAEAQGAFLYRMAANLLIDHARSAQRSSRRNAQWRSEERQIIGSEEIVNEPAADDAMISAERIHLLAEAVTNLPMQMGRAFRLHKLEGLSQAQTAATMGISIKMVEQHIQSAVRHLTSRLKT